MRNSGIRSPLRLFSKNALLTSGKTAGLTFGVQDTGEARSLRVSWTVSEALSMPRCKVGSMPLNEAKSAAVPLGMVMLPRLAARQEWLRKGAVRSYSFFAAQARYLPLTITILFTGHYSNHQSPATSPPRP
jgi:hypothetical protein